jgi:hypothetical protein
MLEIVLQIANNVSDAANWAGTLANEIEFHRQNGNPFDNTWLPRLVWDYCCGNY